jgi:murein DD-endopeptidase MepM/ murein hydrolase activator NlpD
MILKTVDSGKHWRLQSVIQSGEERMVVRSASAVDSAHAWVLFSKVDDGKDYLLRTINGEVWQVLPIMLDIAPKKILFTDPMNGWLIANEFAAFDRLYRTTDGGASWTPENIGFEGTFYDIAFDGSNGYCLASLSRNPADVSVLKSVDGGGIWILGQEFKPDPEATLTGLSIHAASGRTVLLFKSTAEQEMEEITGTVLVLSDNGFASYQTNKITYEKESKLSSVLLSELTADSVAIYALDRIPLDNSNADRGGFFNIVRSMDQGKTWRRHLDITGSIEQVLITGGTFLAATKNGEVLYYDTAEQVWRSCDIDFKGLYVRPPSGPVFAGLTSILHAEEMDVEDFDRDTTYTSRWESEADSALAVSFARVADIKKYRANDAVDFSVGIDSAVSTQIVFHRRVRRGARHGPLDLIRDELLKGEIRLRKYKTMRLVGAVRAVNGRRAVRYSWSSSINGELSDQIAFTTTPRQLVAGTHYLFFKAMDQDGRWSDPVVLKVIVEDFPKYRFPFHGTWTVGGGGSYYNRGRHIRGIRYALDLNYGEGLEGGDSDYGLPVRASTDGVVAFAGYVRGYGRTVKIDYYYGGNKYTTLVTHLATISVEVGEKVRQGQELGTCGSTGRSSAPHVHWELRINDVCVEPEPVFENDSTVVQSIRNGASFTSDNQYQPDRIVVVDEPNVPNTWLEHRGYLHSYRWISGTLKTPTVEAVWKPVLKRSGKYKVQVHIPKKFATGMATYRVQSRQGPAEVKINQNKFTDEWVTLGVYDFAAGGDGHVSLNNVTGQARRTVAFDAVRFIGQWEHAPVGLETNP